MKNIVLAVLVILLISCSSRPLLSNQQWQAEVAAKVSQWQLETVDSITAFSLSSWSSLGEKYLILKTNPFTPYLIELNARCPGLSFANAILTNQFSSTSLSAKFDSIAIPGDAGLSCQISKIYPLTREQDKELVGLDSPIDTDASPDVDANSVSNP